MRAIRLFMTATIMLAFCQPSHAEDWPKYKRDFQNSGLSSEFGIFSGNVSSLQAKWKFSTQAVISASPAVATINGVSTVFIGSWNGNFYAINAVTGLPIWSMHACNCKIFASPAVSNGVVYFAGSDAAVHALNAASGNVVWTRQLHNPSQGYAIYSSPVVFNGVVYLGVSSLGDIPCIPGEVWALNAATGTTAWTFNAIDQTSCPGGACVGAGVWSSPAVDVISGIVYIGTGNGGSTCSPATANAARYPNSILALRATNGQLLNFFQAQEGTQTHDFDFGSSPVLFITDNRNSCTRTQVAQSWVVEPSKNDIMYVVKASSSGLGTAFEIPLDTNPVLPNQPRTTPAIFNVDRAGRCVLGSTIGTVSTRDWVVVNTSGNADNPGGVGEVIAVDVSTTNPAMTWRDVVVPASVTRPSPTCVADPPGVNTTCQDMLSSPAIISDLGFFGSNDGFFYGMEVGANGGSSTIAPGTVVFKFATGGPIWSSPAISNGRIYFGSTDGFLYCLSINRQ